MSPILLSRLSCIARDQRDSFVLRRCQHIGVRPYSALAIATYRATRDDHRRCVVMGQDWRNL